MSDDYRMRLPMAHPAAVQYPRRTDPDAPRVDTRKSGNADLRGWITSSAYAPRSRRRATSRSMAGSSSPLHDTVTSVHQRRPDFGRPYGLSETARSQSAPGSRTLPQRGPQHRERRFPDGEWMHVAWSRTATRHAHDLRHVGSAASRTIRATHLPEHQPAIDHSHRLVRSQISNVEGAVDSVLLWDVAGHPRDRGGMPTGHALTAGCSMLDFESTALSGGARCARSMRTAERAHRQAGQTRISTFTLAPLPLAVDGFTDNSAITWTLTCPEGLVVTRAVWLSDFARHSQCRLSRSGQELHAYCRCAAMRPFSSFRLPISPRPRRSDATVVIGD